MRAKYLMRLDGTDWRQAFEPDSETKLKGYQSDYPPFLSLVVMRSWKWASNEDPLAPALIGALLTFGAIGLVGHGVAVIDHQHVHPGASPRDAGQGTLVAPHRPRQGKYSVDGE